MLHQRKASWFRKYSVNLLYQDVYLHSKSTHNLHTLYQYVTERHSKTKVSGFLTGSIWSLWLSQTTPYLQRMVNGIMDGKTTDEWIYYFSPAGCCFYCQHCPSYCFPVLSLLLFLLLHKHWPSLFSLSSLSLSLDIGSPPCQSSLIFGIPAFSSSLFLLPPSQQHHSISPSPLSLSLALSHSLVVNSRLHCALCSVL